LERKDTNIDGELSLYSPNRQEALDSWRNVELFSPTVKFKFSGSHPTPEDPTIALNSQLLHILDLFTLTTGKLSLNTDLIDELICNHQRKAPLQAIVF